MWLAMVRRAAFLALMVAIPNAGLAPVAMPPVHAIFVGGSMPPVDVLGVDEAHGTLLAETHNPTRIVAITLADGVTRRVIDVADDETVPQVALDATTEQAVVAHSTPTTRSTTLTVYDLVHGTTVHTATLLCCAETLVVAVRSNRTFLIGLPMAFSAARGLTLTAVAMPLGTVVATSTIEARSVVASAVDDPDNRMFLIVEPPLSAGVASGGPAASDELMTVDATTGVVIRITPLGGLPRLIIVDPRTHRAFVVGTRGSPVAMVDATTGGVSTMIPGASIPDRIYTAPTAIDTRRGRFYIAGVSGVSAYDASTGAPRGFVRLDGNAVIGSLAVDERTGHLYAGVIGAGYSNGGSLLVVTTYVGVLDVATGRARYYPVGRAQRPARAVSPDVDQMRAPALTVDALGDRLLLAGYLNVSGPAGRGNTVGVLDLRAL